MARKVAPVTTATSRAGISRAERRPGGLRRGEAFTLIEVVIALAIVSIALLGLLELQLNCLTVSESARTSAMAVLIAQEKAAEIAADGWPALGAKSGATEMDGSQFSWRTEVSAVDAVASCGPVRGALRQVAVNVTWRDGGGPRTMQMTTYVADRRIP